MAPKPPSRTGLYKRRVNGREIVLRDGVCGCDTILYTANLTDNQIEFRAKERWVGRNNPVQRYQLIEPEGNPTVLGITCPDCGTRHKIVHIKEGMNVVDAVAIKTAGV